MSASLRLPKKPSSFAPSKLPPPLLKAGKLPHVVESFGGWDKWTNLFEEDRRSRRSLGLEIKHFFQRLSVALQQGNAALLLDRDPEPLVYTYTRHRRS